MALVPTLLAAVLNLLVCSAAHADLYRWTDESGEEHFSNVPGDAPPGAVVEPVPGGATTPSPSDPRQIPSPAAGTGSGRSDAPAIAPASLDIERYESVDRFREVRKRQAEVDDQLRALAAANAAAPHVGEGAMQAFERRTESEIALQAQRDAVTKQLGALRAQYADLCRRAAKANGGALPLGWDAELD